jgi:hypothetical protein
MPTQPVESPETYHRLEDRLEPGNNLFSCGNCTHYVGDPRRHNFLSRCPGCDRINRFYRIIE